MKKNLEQFADQTILKARKRKVRRRILALLSVFVLFVTTNQLIFAADTLEHIAACGLAEHTHTEACYGPDGELDCGLKEHEHTDACYQERPKAEAKDAEEPVDAEDEDEETSEEPYELDEFELGAEEEEEVLEEVGFQAEETQDYEYTMGSQPRVSLDEILEKAGLSVEGSIDVGQVVDEGHPEGMIRIERDGNDIAIVPTRDFKRVELAVMTDDAFYTVNLLNAVVPEEASEDDAAEAETEETVPVTGEEAVEAEETEEQTPVGENEEETEVGDEADTAEENAPADENEDEVFGEDAEAEAEAEDTTETENTTETIETVDNTDEETVVEEAPAAEEGENENKEEAAPAEDVNEESAVDESENENNEEVAPAEDVNEAPAADESENENNEEVAPAEDVNEEPAAEEGENVEETAPAETEEESAVEPAAEEASEAAPEEEEEAEAPAPVDKKTIAATIDLTDAVAPFSLKAWMAQAQPEEEAVDAEPAEEEAAVEEEAAGEAPEALPVDAWTLEYDAAVFAVEPAEADYIVTPLCDFESATFAVETGDQRIELTLTNWTAPEEALLEAAEAVVYAATIDLADAAAPFSLADWMAQARPEDAEEPVPAEEWEIEYDEAIFTVDPAEEDYSVTPAADFEEAAIAVKAGEVHYELTLVNYTAAVEVSEVLAGKVAVDVEGADYSLLISVPEEAELPADATFKAVAVNDETYNTAALGAIERDEGMDYTVLATFDLTIYDGETSIQPKAALNVGVDFGGKLDADMQVVAVHFPGTGAQAEDVVEDEEEPMLEAQTFRAPMRAMQMEDMDLELEEEEVGAEISGTETLTATNDGNGVASFQSDSFSVYAIVGASLTTDITLPGMDGIFEVTVTYGPEAMIPENAQLSVTAFAEDSDEYIAAKDKIVAAKKANDEDFDENDLGFAALDISILDELGEKVEPAEGAEVTVSIRMKELPEGVSEETLAETMEVQHLNESNDATVIENVAKAQDVMVGDGAVEAEFKVSCFSTFTITWNSPTDTTASLRLRAQGRTGNQYNNTVGQVEFNYVNSDDAAITRPSSGTIDIQVSYRNNNFTDHEVVISSNNVAGAISGRTYQRAYIIDGGEQKDFTRILFSRTGNNSWRTAYYNGNTLVTTASGSNVTGDWRIPAYLEYSSLDNEGTTIHYGYMDGSTFVEFSQDDLPPTPVEIDSSGSTHFAYLIYDFDGYHYADETYYHTSATTTPGTGGTQTQPLLRWSGSGNKWTYTSSGDLHTYHNSNNQSDVQNGSHLYVIYEKDTAIAQGGTPKVSLVNQDEEPEPPTLTKDSKGNGDGTNTITLGITGSTTKLEVEKLADVIVVFDVSTSMHLNLDGTGSYGSGAYDINGSNRIANAGRAAESLAASLLEKKNSNGEPLVRMALVPFSMTASVHSFNGNNFTTDIDEFNAAVEGLQLSSGTNWEDALMKANQLAVDPDRATFVIFVTDGEPSMRVSRGSYTDAEIASENGNAAQYLARTTFYGGLSSDNTKNYDLAVPAATDIVSANKNLYTIGISSDVSTLTQLTIDSGAGADHSKTATSEDELVQAFNDIEASIIALLGAGDVKITDGITSLTNLEAKVLETVDPNSFKYYRYGGLKTTTVDGEEVTTNDKYGAGYGHKTEWTTREADGCAAATYDKASESVQWNMGRNFQLEEDVTYVVEFRVWPSQEAYDLIANLNNGTKEYRVKDSESDTKGLTQEEYGQVVYDSETNSYSLKTNTDDVDATYTLCTKTGVTVSYEEDAEVKKVNYEEGTIENMELMSHLMTLKKEWAHEFNASHAGDMVKFYLKVGDAGYYQNDGSVSPSEANADSLVLSNPNWTNSIHIAPGMLDYVDGTVHVLETGHEYELYEYEITQTDSTDNYIASYDFISEIVRPMRVNGIIKYLVKYTNASEIPEGITETYTIDGKTYYVRPGSGDSGLISGTNYRRAEMDITKIINKGTSSLTEEQLNKEVFTYRATLRMPADANLSLITGWQFVYNPDNPNWTIQGYQEEDEPLPGDETRFAGHKFRWGTFNYNGTAIGSAVEPDDEDPENYVKITMDLSMYPNQVLRLTNLPMGTEYSIKEVYANNRTLQSNGLMSNASVVPTTNVPSNLEAEGYNQISSQSTFGTASGSTISGTISVPNRRYYNQFTNTIGNLAAADLQVTKRLDGYTWSGERYYFTLEAGEHKNAGGNVVGESPLPASTSLYLSNADGSGDRSYGFGSIKFHEEGTYSYTVKEARYRAGDSTDIVDIDQTAETILGTAIIFEKPVTYTVTVSKDSNGSLCVEKVEGDRTKLTGTVVNTTFTNRQPCNVEILKLGNSLDPLSEVQFAVYSDSALTTLVTADAKGNPVGNNGVITTDENGFASLGAMVTGTTYYLVETNTADGYNLLSAPVVITFNGTSVTATCDQEGVIFNNPDWIYQKEDRTWVVKINNTSGYVLPSTGGVGTRVYTASGIAMILLAAALLIAKRRRA